jgi:hypothetical protein
VPGIDGEERHRSKLAQREDGSGPHHPVPQPLEDRPGMVTAAVVLGH